MGIEGAEFDVLQDILRGNHNIDPILGEFQHGIIKRAIKKTRETIFHFSDHNLDIVAVSEKGVGYYLLRIARVLRIARGMLYPAFL
jgi:hypothetical protein